jgi:peptidoglycan/LPS O-acetylase OafA/YrhL
LFFLTAVASSIAIASASYWMFEQPFLRLKNRFRKADRSIPQTMPFPVPEPASELNFDPIRV